MRVETGIAVVSRCEFYWQSYHKMLLMNIEVIGKVFQDRKLIAVVNESKDVVQYEI